MRAGGLAREDGEAFPGSAKPAFRRREAGVGVTDRPAAVVPCAGPRPDEGERAISGVSGVEGADADGTAAAGRRRALWCGGPGSR
jgi:hypothetical protein